MHDIWNGFHTQSLEMNVPPFILINVPLEVDYHSNTSARLKNHNIHPFDVIRWMCNDATTLCLIFNKQPNNQDMPQLMFTSS